MRKENKYVCITTNEQCNLSCIYCYEHDKAEHKSFNVEDTKKKLHQLLSSAECQKVIIDFHGGEPFLIFDKIRRICDWAWNQSFPQNYMFYATTNGTLIHGEIKEWLLNNKCRFNLNLSLDGTRKMHNANRSNSFDLIDVDFFAENWPTQEVKMTVSPYTLSDLAEGVQYLHSKGFKNIEVHFAYMVNWNNPKYLKTYYRELSKLSNFYKLNPKLNQASIFRLDMIAINKQKNKIKKWCGIGEESLQCYSIEGEKYPCHLFLENVCGKDKSQAWCTIDFNDPNEYIMGECCSCPIYPLCPTCYAANYIERGKIGLRDMNRCRLEKVRTLVVAKHQYEMLMSDNGSYDNLSQHEIRNRVSTLKAIEKIAPVLEEYQQMIDELR